MIRNWSQWDTPPSLSPPPQTHTGGLQTPTEFEDCCSTSSCGPGYDRTHTSDITKICIPRCKSSLGHTNQNSSTGLLFAEAMLAEMDAFFGCHHCHRVALNMEMCLKPCKEQIPSCPLSTVRSPFECWKNYLWKE